jgi:hypothetical protein
MTGCRSWTYMKKLNDYHQWVSQLAAVEAEDSKEHERASARCFLVHKNVNDGRGYPMTVPALSYDDRRQYTHALLSFKTPHYDNMKQRMV